ncbi:MAG: hypothetical protein WC197_07125 [Candidatus Gastranaerophilaceae bacterium]
MVKLNDERGFKHLKQFGINSINDDSIRSEILAKKTKLEFAENKLINNGKKESFNIYKKLASVQFELKRNIDVEMCLAEWVETLADLYERRKAQAELESSNKRKNRR